MIVVTLPWPDKRLSPNARVHWVSRWRKTKQARRDAFVVANAAMSKQGMREWGDGDIHLTLELVPPDRRKRDDDNIIASCKSYRDGVADALGVDDSTMRLERIVWKGPAKPGQITIVVRGDE